MPWELNLRHVHLRLHTVQLHGGYHGLGVDHCLHVELVHDFKLLLLELDLASRECITKYDYTEV